MRRSGKSRLRLEGIAEATRSAFLFNPQDKSSHALWKLGAELLTAKTQSEDVPLRVAVSLLDSIPTLAAENPPDFFVEAAKAVQRAATARILHGMRKVGPLHVRALVRALWRSAPHVPISDSGLPLALLQQTISPAGLYNFKRRGRTGAKRLVAVCEQLAELQRSQDRSAASLQSSATSNSTFSHADDTFKEQLRRLYRDITIAVEAAKAVPSVADKDADRKSLENEADAWAADLDRMDFSVAGRVERMAWALHAWDDHTLARLKCSLEALLGDFL